MTTTVMCNACGTRNQAAMGHCRRCKAPLSGNALAASDTVRGTPTSSLLDERWSLEERAQSMAPGWWEGHDVANKQPVLIRTLSYSAFESLDEIQLLDLARRRQDITHPGLLSVVGVTTASDGVYMVYSHRAGSPLRKVLAERRPLPLQVALHFFEGVIAAAETLHEHGLVHGSLSPATIWVDDEGVSGVPAALVAGGVRPREPLDVAGDYRGSARVLGAMLLGHNYEPQMNAGVVIGAATERIKVQCGTQVASKLRELFDVLVRADGTALRKRRDAIIDAVSRLGDGEDWSMMPVARGPFMRGSDETDANARPEERPSAMVDVGAFFIDRTPVTALEYKRFLDATRRTPSREWLQFNNPVERPAHPVVYVNWADARAYARWAGKRLPTEAEWEKAARGTDGRIYPWGDEPPDERLAWFGDKSGPEPVGERRLGQSMYGVCDMAGNVLEWVHDWFDRDYYADAPLSDPPGPTTGTKRVLRGGSYAHSAVVLRCATRGRYDPTARRANHSFRCVWSLHSPK